MAVSIMDPWTMTVAEAYWDHRLLGIALPVDGDSPARHAIRSTQREEPAEAGGPHE